MSSPQIVGNVQATLDTQLSRALDKLSTLETPTPEAQAFVRHQSSVEIVDDDAPAEAAPVEAAAVGRPAPARRVAAPAPIETTPPESTPAAPTTWGPQQQQALHQILQSNTEMEKELASLREKTQQFESALADARAGDIGSFSKKAAVPEDVLREGLNDGPTPVTKPYVRKLEGTVSQLAEKLDALQRQLEARDTAEKQKGELAEITQHLNSQEEYGILKQIPDIAQRVQHVLKTRESEARARGEIAPAMSVDAAARMLKAEFITTLKRLTSDELVRKELGLQGDSVPPDTVKPRSRKAITGTMSSQGTPTQKTFGYSAEDQLRKALKAIS